MASSARDTNVTLAKVARGWASCGRRLAGLAALAPVAFSTSAQAAVVWDEPLNGDLNDLYWYNGYSGTGPGSWTELGTLSGGTSTVLGSLTNRYLGNFSYNFEGDAIRFTIPAGFQLDSLTINSNKPLGIREFFRHNGSTSGNTAYVFRTFPETGRPAGTNDLVALYAPGGAPLGPGTYVVSWMNSVRPNSVDVMDYSMNLVVAPTPGTYGLALLGMLAVGRRRR